MFIVFNVRFRFPTRMPLLIQFIVCHQMNRTAFTEFGVLVAWLEKDNKINHLIEMEEKKRDEVKLLSSFVQKR